MPRLISPRSGAKKAAETTFDMGGLAAILIVAVPVMRARGWLPTEVTDIQVTAAVMALGAILTRIVRHLWVYRRG